jgi:hypothetical protein
MCTAVLGFPDKSLRLALEFLASAREGAQLVPLAFALNAVTTILAWHGEGALALKHAEDLLALASEHGFTLWHSVGQITHGQALALSGRADEAIAELRTALDSFAATGAAVPGWQRAALASAYLTANQPAEGLKVTAEALERSHTGDLQAQPELLRLNGELLLMDDPKKVAAGEESLSRLYRGVAQTVCKVARTSRDHESGAVAGETEQERRSPRDAHQNLQLVHRGLRHRRPQGCEGATR